MASANTIFKKLLNVKGIVIENSTFYDDSFRVQHLDLKVRPTRYAECRCPVCGRKRPKDGLSVRTDRTWRSLDFGAVIVHLKGYTQRIKCPEHGSIVADVPWAYPGSRFTKDFDLTVGWLAEFLPKNAVSEYMRNTFSFYICFVTIQSAPVIPSQCRNTGVGIRLFLFKLHTLFVLKRCGLPHQ